MKLRAPAYPLITIDPYMSVWSMGDRLNAGTVRHWTGRDMPLDGLADIDGETYVFMGDAGRLGLRAWSRRAWRWRPSPPGTASRPAGWS